MVRRFFIELAAVIALLSQGIIYPATAVVTYIDYAYDADTFFPNLDEKPEWKLAEESEEQTYYDIEFYFRTYTK